MEQIRQHTLKTMKPEIAPWAKDYTPKMEDIHTKLLVRNRHRDTGVELSHYEKLFASGKSKKILVSGRLGTGKTLLGKKMAHDWAQGVFTTFSIVFFVSMKLLSPGTAIENAIVKQYSAEGMNIPEQTVQFMLETMGRKILIIVDDMEEDLFSIHLGSKFSFLVTSCCSDKDSLWKEFEKVCEIQNFSETEKKRTMSLLLKNESEMSTI